MSSILYISKSNSIPFVKTRTSRYFNDENSFSFEENKNSPNKIAYQYIHYFEDNDSPKTQVKSNCDSIVVEVYEGKNIINTIIPQKLTNNLNTNVFMECEIIDSDTDDEKLVIFKEGNYFNYDTHQVSGSYFYNGSLPEFIQENNNFKDKIVEISGSLYLITGIKYNEENESFGLITEAAGLSNGVQDFKATYDKEETEIYEFETPFYGYTGKSIVIKVTGYKENSPTKSFFSEVIKISEQINGLEILYKGDEDSDIHYSTGIYNILRFNLEDKIPYIKDEFENETTDNSSYLLDSSVYRGDEFKVSGLTQSILDKLSLAISHEYVMINGQKYIKDGNIEYEFLGDSNLIECSFKMLKSGETTENDLLKFTSTNFNLNIIISNEEDFMINEDGSFISY